MAMCKTITPYLSKGSVWEVATKGGTRTWGVVELHDIGTTMVACAHAEDSIRKYEKKTYLAVVTVVMPLFFIMPVPPAVTRLWTYGRIGGHTMIVRHAPHDGFMMGKMMWPI